MCSYFKAPFSVSVWYIWILSSLTKILGMSPEPGLSHSLLSLFLSLFLSFTLSLSLPLSPTIQGCAEERGFWRRKVWQEAKRGRRKKHTLRMRESRKRTSFGMRLTTNLEMALTLWDLKYPGHWGLKNNWEIHFQKQSGFPCSELNRAPGPCQLATRTGEMGPDRDRGENK